MGKRSTIRDVAKAAGVSITTTSQVIKGIGNFSEATIKRVWQVVNELNYTPNPYAKKYFSGENTPREKTGLLMYVTYSPYDKLPCDGNDYGAHRMYCFEKACMSHDCIGSNYIYRHQMGFRCRQIVNGLVDGVILGTQDKTLIENLKPRLPLVLTDVNVEPGDVGLSVINPDLCSAYVQVFSQIREAGIDGKVAVFCGIENEKHFLQSIIKAENRTIELKKAIKQCDIDIDRKHYFDISVDPDINEMVLEKIADKICLLVKNEGVRIIVLRYIQFQNLPRMLAARGLHLPGDVLLLGVNTMQKESKSGVIQIVYDWDKLMKTAVDVLLQTIENQEQACGKFLIPCNVISELTGENQKNINN
ncbi:MAG: LacI family DNA-binding transcriptional regulator [Lentisphaeria bacterium]|nr:LacI family DNA-binding transcriptional regulator [Lentisphaeria bacterium]